MPEIHFLDTNVLIASRIAWDTHSKSANDFFQTKDNQYITSYFVRRECQSVLENLRRVISKYLRKLFGEINNTNPIRLNQSIIKYCSTYCRSLLRENERGAIKTFTNTHLHRIIEVLLNNTEENREDYIKLVADSITTSIRIFLSECNKYESAKIVCYNCPKDYSTRYQNELESLQLIIDCHNDVCILLDAYHLKKSEFEIGLIFSTYDKNHIIDNKEIIESLLIGIIIYSPK